MYFTTSSLFLSFTFGFHTAESILRSAALETYHTTWYTMVQEFRHITMTAHLKKKLFQISPTAETSAAVPATLTGYHPVRFPVEYYSV
jgi:tRNA(Leu) C34 or U34 (ribose-2'-O)-methylase TrmL